ncbi:MAG: sodium:solute symporter [Psychroserpens sp.]|uniref:sodium:solute symporter n=1 Tax=Psychroserpens sp. TaxID=2020870 RepID=UPI003C7492F3
MNDLISSIDLIVIAVYFCIVFIIGFVVARKTESGEDLFLGGRTLTWGVIGFSLFASNISSTTMIGLTGAAYSSGIVQSVYEWISGIPLIIAAFIFIPLYLKSQITTIPEFLNLRYDRRSQVFFSAITIITSVIVDTAGGLYAGALVLKTFFPDLIIWQTCFVLAVIAGLYTAFGGLKAVVYTDTLQAIVLIVGSSILTYIMFEKIDFSLERMISSAPEGHFSIIKPIDDETLPWPGLFLGVPLLGFWYWSTNQYIVQRVLGSKNIKHARWGLIFGGFLKLIPLFIMVVPGAMAISIYTDIQNPDMVFPTIVLRALPVGLVGLVLAGLISAIMSTVDSTLNSASTLIVIDFIKPKKPNITSKEVAKYGRITTFVLMLIAAAWAPMIVNFGGIWIYLQQMFTIFVPPIVVLFLLGVFYKRGNAEGAFWTLVIGVSMGILLFILEQYGFWPIHFTINAGIVVALSSIVFVVVSRMTKPPPQEKITNLTYSKGLIDAGNENMPWYKNYKYYAYLLFVCIGVLFVLLF